MPNDQEVGMAIRLKYRSPSGESRAWTLKEIAQGKPLGHPSHPLLVHFPLAFYFGVLGLDIMSKVGTFPSAPLATNWLLLGAFAATAGAVVTGLVDWTTMRKGSITRHKTNQHILFQLITAGLFVVNFAIRWGDRHLAEAKPLWIVLDVVGVITLTIGQYLGGMLVYGIGFRVGEQPPASPQRPAAPASPEPPAGPS
jgi:uncharacterized membrane protein